MRTTIIAAVLALGGCAAPPEPPPPSPPAVTIEWVQVVQVPNPWLSPDGARAYGRIRETLELEGIPMRGGGSRAMSICVPTERAPRALEVVRPLVTRERLVAWVAGPP